SLGSRGTNLRAASARRPCLDGSRHIDAGAVDRNRDQRQCAGLKISMADIVLELQGISKAFGLVIAADELSLAVERGEFFTFLWPSGSGKSTILRMVAGLERPDSGRILLGGRDIAGVPPWRRNLGMMFQQYAVFPHMNVAENIEYGLKLRRLGQAERRIRVDR